jgi:hypothetical protein
MDISEIELEGGLDSCAVGYKPEPGPYEHGDEHSVSIKGEEILD